MSTPRPPLTRRCHVCGYRYESTSTACPLDEVNLGRERPGVDRLGPYKLVERLGTGGMGAVYRAVHEKVGRAVAVKLLHRSLRSEGVSVSRFFQEARAVNTIRHPNVVEIHDLSGDGDDLYMVLELLRGNDLRSVIDAEPERRLPPERAVFILEQVCGALQAAHARNIVHRDLKPENVFLTNRQGRADFVKLLDFGIAKLERTEGRLTREGIALGTPEYMAPEQARGAEVDGRTDLYAVGCIAYEMLTGHTVFEGKSPGDVMLKQVKEAPLPLRRHNPAVPEALEAVILRCLAKSPSGRPASGLDLAQELCAAVKVPFDQSGAFMSWRNWDGASSLSTVTGMEWKPVNTSRNLVAKVRRVLRRPRHLAGVSAAAAVLLIAGAAAVWGFGPSKQTQTAPASLVVASASRGPEVQPLGRIELQSSPPGAELVTATGERLGVTPHRLTLPVGKEVRVRFQRPGFRSVERSVRADGDDRTVAVALEPEGEVAAPTRARATTKPGKRAAVSGARRPARKTDATRTLNPF